MNTMVIEEHWIDTPLVRYFAKSWTPKASAVEPYAPILLFHDSLGSVELWRDFPHLLATATSRRVVAYDRFGFGRSSSHPGGWSVGFIDDEAEHCFPVLQNSLAFTNFVAFGHSVGGAMAAACASRYSTQCEALITESAQAYVDTGVLEGIRQSKQFFESNNQIDRLAKYHGDKALWVLSTWCDTWLSEAFASWTINQSAPNVLCPQLVFHGDRDEYGSIDHARYIATLSNDSSNLIILNECGHVPHREYPDVIVRETEKFLRHQIPLRQK